MGKEKPRPIGLDELAQLTMRANVAFAARCARRMRPWFKLPADAARRIEQTAAVDGAIAVAEEFCRGLSLEIGRAAEAARVAAMVAEETYEDTNYAGFAAVRAAEAAACAEEAVRNPSDSGMIEVVAAAFGAGRVLAANAGAFTQHIVVAALRDDIDKLLQLAHGTIQDLGPPVDPSETGPLGPLWPGATPIGFTDDT
jgi:hypothetical protein